ncbi:MAG TPA: restriction endonuclease subunit S, partial [Ignavibacteria bacterium]|nr:restriction endonuclease subunit S [Ignavibacteria bacterium]
GNIPCIDQSTNFIGGFTNDKDALHMEPLPIIIFGDHTRILKYIDFPFASGADGTQLIYPKGENISVEYLYLSLINVNLSNYYYARHFKFLKECEILISSSELIIKFTNIIKPIFNQIINLKRQIILLSKARDLLIPKLINGEIEV